MSEELELIKPLLFSNLQMSPFYYTGIIQDEDIRVYLNQHEYIADK